MSLRYQSLAVASAPLSDADDDDERRPTVAKGSRTSARRAAVQALYQWRMAGTNAAALIDEFARAGRLDGVDRGYFETLLVDTLADARSLAAIFDRFLDRPAVQLDPVEYVVLLLACFELRDRLEVPAGAVLNEAINLARLFGATDGHRFVNGVLDRVARELRPKPGATGS